MAGSALLAIGPLGPTPTPKRRRHGALARAAPQAGGTMSLLLRLLSVHGRACPLPWLASAELQLAHQTDAPPLMLDGATSPPWTVELTADATLQLAER